MDKGTIKTLDQKRGHGLILTREGQEVFFHQSVVRKVGYEELREGDSVKFETGYRKRKDCDCATRVQPD